MEETLYVFKDRLSDMHDITSVLPYFLLTDNYISAQQQQQQQCVIMVRYKNQKLRVKKKPHFQKKLNDPKKRPVEL